MAGADLEMNRLAHARFFTRLIEVEDRNASLRDSFRLNTSTVEYYQILSGWGM
jgi:hypothetical protein